MMEIFTAAGHATIPTGMAHGTVTVLVDHTPVECTTYRLDGDYTDARRPDSVRFTDRISDDLARRDFTVNAMAYHPTRGLGDYFGGKADLEARILRAVGDPRRRFQEDALRILRALRFSATLGFAIEEETARAAREAAPLLLRVSAERVREEMTKLLVGDHAPRVLAEFLDIFAILFPAWYAALTEHKPPEAAIAALGAHLAASPRETVARYAVFFSPFASAKEASDAMDALRFDHRTRDRAVKLLSHRNDPCTADTRVARRFLSSLGAEDAALLLAIRRAERISQGESGKEEIEAACAVSRLLLTEGECTSVSDLAVSGRDLLALGFSAGREMGLALRALFLAVTDGQVKNEKSALLSYAERELKK
jgi:tRNA nucleotidyltransferase (CCA-adding enzyme)